MWEYHDTQRIAEMDHALSDTRIRLDFLTVYHVLFTSIRLNGLLIYIHLQRPLSSSMYFASASAASVNCGFPLPLQLALSPFTSSIFNVVFQRTSATSPSNFHS
ncbi:hypothetical protein F5880DRAFT_360531 [Lentinula raphanica]|nr:hypothetical protein F5880DRAFT_360531 [Lentinula raphanica]